MKKNASFAIISLTFLSLFALSCCASPKKSDQTSGSANSAYSYSQNNISNECLEYVLDEDGQHYTVNGIGTYRGSEVTIPGEYNSKPVTSIADEAFRDCPGVTRITIEKGISTIGNHAFSGCCDLISISLPDGLISIGDEAFAYCNRIEKIIIPNTIKEVGMNILKECSNIKYNFVGNDPDYPSDGNLYLGNQDNPYLVLVKNTYSDNDILFMSDVKIHQDTEIIAGRALSNLPYLKRIIFSEGIRYIGDYALSGCTSLKNVTISDTVTHIGSSAFSECKQLQTVDLGSKISKIGSYAFFNCNAIISVSIPSIEAWLNIDFETVESNPLYYCLDKGSFIVNNIPITSVIIPNGITSIPNYAFSNFRSLESVDICDSVKVIGYGAFMNCELLNTVNNSENIEEIKADAFNNCQALKVINIPGSIATIGEDVFKDCQALQYTELENGCYLGDEENPYLVLVKAKSTKITSCKIHENTKIILEAFNKCTVLESLTIPESVTKINWKKCFDGCSALKWLTIGKGITSIDDYALMNCKKLESITIPKTIVKIGKSALENCESLQNIYYSGTMGEWENLSKGYMWDAYSGNYTVYSSDIKMGISKNSVLLRSIIMVLGNETGVLVFSVAFIVSCSVGVVIAILLKKQKVKQTKPKNKPSSPAMDSTDKCDAQKTPLNEAWWCDCGYKNPSSVKNCQNCFKTKND